MPTLKADVVLLPVAAVPDEDGELRLAVYRPGGRWLRERLRSASPAEVARAALGRADLPLVRDVGLERAPEPVTFVASDGALVLIYTFALPLSSPFLDSGARVRGPESYRGDWPELAVVGDEDPLAFEVREYWRQLLEETSAVVELLPRYFTTPQARSVYDSLWGREQDAGNFHKWLHELNEGVLVKVEDEDVIREQVEGFARERLRRSPELAGVSLLKAMPKAMVGVSPTLIAGSALGGLPGVVLAGTVAAGMVAFQARRQPGKQPDWYTAAQPGRRRRLPHIFSPRPEWLGDG